MNRRQFLSGLGAAFVGWMARGVKVEEEADQPAPVGGTLLGRPVVWNQDLDTGIDGDIVLGDLETYKFLGPIHVSEELLQDAIGPLPLHFSFPHATPAWRWTSEAGFTGPGYKPATTRVRHQVSHYASFIRDEARISALYDVQGTEKRLVVEWWLSHEGADDEAVVEALLEKMDEEAEWSAAHPEEGITASGEWV